MKQFFWLFLIPLALFAQNIPELRQQIIAGQAELVKKQLPALMQQYPNNGELLYLSGVVETDGEAALLIYRDVLSRYPGSVVADDAFLKIIEYLFTKGLYAKTDKYAREFIRTYPRSELIDRTVYMQLCSLNAMNQRDSVDFYYRFYSARYPDLDFHFKNYKSTSNLALTETGSRPQPSRQQPASSPSPLPVNTPKPEARSVTSAQPGTSGNYTLQMGVFSNPANAKDLRLKLERLGYPVDYKKIERSGRTLTVVLTGSFMTESEAQAVGNKLKKEKNLDFVVVKK
jgi:tetratricopeptide (TPR) repeat protein